MFHICVKIHLKLNLSITLLDKCCYSASIPTITRWHFCVNEVLVKNVKYSMVFFRFVHLMPLFVVGSLKTEYKHDAAMVTADMDLGLTALNATAVMGHKGWLAGYQTCFDLTKSAVTKNNFGIGYSTSDMVLHTSLTNGTEFGGEVIYEMVH